MIDVYNRIYSESKEYIKEYFESVYFPVWNYVLDNINENEKVLDLGCGPSHLGIMLFEKGIKNYTGIDFSDVAIKMAKINLLPYTYIESDLFNIHYGPYRDYTIVATEVFEHIDDVKLIKRLPKSKILFSVPNFHSETHERTYKDEAHIMKYYKGLIEISDIKEFKIKEKVLIFAATGKII